MPFILVARTKDCKGWPIFPGCQERPCSQCGEMCLITPEGLGTIDSGERTPTCSHCCSHEEYLLAFLNTPQQVFEDCIKLREKYDLEAN